ASNPLGGVWVGSWLTAPTAMPLKDGVGDRTFRSVAHLSLGGTALRVELTNQFGTTPLQIGSAHVGLSAGAGKVQADTDHALTFNHQATVSIPAGSYVLSDPVPLPVSDFADLAISVYLPQQTVTEPTCHEYALSTTYMEPGDATTQTELTDAKTMTSTCFLQSVIVQSTDKKAAAVVALGDSITDGAHSSLDTNHRYPDDLAVRLHADKKTAHLAVLNAGIAGGRVLYEGHGPSALERFDRDVLAQPGVRYVIYLEGINDIGQVTRAASPERDLTAEDLIFAATQLVERAHLHGVKVIGATLTPFGPKIMPNRPGWSRIRPLIEQYNEWVRTSNTFDAVADFNKATADPQNPQTLLPAFDSGDHGHPTDAGYKAMADSIDLSIFR
ncbi:MAG TPA: SGNH/GDSL hydrolase family protein, partial [Candidatus Aquilonibacter sp.]|nr:SGNH/GDSL hydrolase family protein [Candidatus Aquilonibacter sp.]